MAGFLWGTDEDGVALIDGLGERQEKNATAFEGNPPRYLKYRSAVLKILSNTHPKIKDMVKDMDVH